MLAEPVQVAARFPKQFGNRTGFIQWKQILSLDPTAWAQPATAWFQNTESIQVGGTMLPSSGSNNLTLTSSTNFISTDGVWVKITTAGGYGVGKFDAGIDNPTRTTKILTGATIQAAVALTGTRWTLNFANVSYVLNTLYEAICSSWLDKVGAYPASTNNFSNATGGQRPRVIANGNLGAPCIRFDGVAHSLVCTGALATGLQGTGVTFTFVHLIDLLSIPGSNSGFIYSIGNTTNTHLPRIQLAAQSVGLVATGPAWGAGIIDDTGAAKAASSSARAFTGPALLIDRFDGTKRRLSWNRADYIAGLAGQPASGGTFLQGGQTVTPTQIALGCLHTQGGRSQFGNFDLYWSAGHVNHVLSLQDEIGM